MTAEMRKSLARLPYAEKLRRVAELIEFSRRFKAVRTPDKIRQEAATSESKHERTASFTD